jgi:hypothetical protein
MKQLVQCYKHPSQWLNSPPGLGDFIRGTCHLYELSQTCGFELIVDMHQSGFSRYFQPDSTLVNTHPAQHVATAAEYFVDHDSLLRDLMMFLQGNSHRLYMTTNLGAWNRPTLPPTTKLYMRRLLRFQPIMFKQITQLIALNDYNVISIRCGDGFYDRPNQSIPANYLTLVLDLIQKQVLPIATQPIVITSDSFELKQFLARRFGFKVLPHRSEHGAFNDNIEPVALDLCLLAHSKFNFHINLWAAWWSGFSHFTSLIHDIPSVNFRAPLFIPEPITLEKSDSSETLIKP